jgi:predicted GNAT superfamily acetyltransferase
MTGGPAGAERSGAAAAAEVAIRHCRGLAEFEACVAVQQRVWRGADIDLVPLPLFVVAAETGGQVLGAFAGAQIVGFTLALAGVHGGKPFLHSHMTAVLDDYRDRGIGRGLKLFQRRDALERGIELVEWTFDPLELKNAYFNLVRLGAIVRRFLPNCYGITMSPLHAGLPTDRLMAEWWLWSPRVMACLDAQSGPQRAAPLQTPAREGFKRIRVPAQIGEIREKDPAHAAQIQKEVREQFEHWLARGYAATGVEITAEGGDYLLEPWSNA